MLIDGIVSGVNGSLGIMASSLVFPLLLMGFSPSNVTTSTYIYTYAYVHFHLYIYTYAYVRIIRWYHIISWL